MKSKALLKEKTREAIDLYRRDPNAFHRAEAVAISQLARRLDLELVPNRPDRRLPEQKSLDKSTSVTQRLLHALSEAPRSPYELIEAVWGKDAQDPTYKSRLYAAIRALRKAGHSIRFDGSKYRLN